MRNGSRIWLVFVLLLILSLAFLYRSPYSASALETVPDSVEYAVAAQRLATLGHYNIAINNTVYPPRYPPWFSLLILAPIYKLFAGDIGNGILGVLFFALLGIAAAYAIGYRFGGPWAGAGAALCLMTFKEYRVISRLILTDVPAAVLGLVGCWLYLRMQSGPKLRDYLWSGLVVGLAFAFRVDMVSLCLPFLLMALRNREQRVRNLIVLLLPMLLVEAATLAYNQQAFGDWRRNGYHFWTAVPYDYPSLVWSPRYIKANLVQLFAKQSLLIMAIGVIGIILLQRRKDAQLRPTLIFLALAAGPSELAHLFYFSTGLRFFLLGLSLLAILGGAGLATLIPERIQSRQWALPALLALGLLLVPRIHRSFEVTPTRRVIADGLARVTPTNAVIVTGIEPVYLEPLVLRGTQRTIVPVSRNVEYASKVVVLRKIPDPVPPPVLGQSRSPGMFRGGARDVIPYTADEAPELLLAQAHAGRPVYVDLRFAPSDYPDAKTRRLFRIVPVPGYPWLKRLIPSS